MQPEVVWQLGAELGEGPAWFGDEQALRFVDIKRGHLHRFDPDKGSTETAITGGAPSFILPAAGGGQIVGSRQGIYHSDGSGLGRLMASLPERAHNRTNDATVDAAGRLWISTMDDEEHRPTGSLWRFHRGKLRRAIAGFVVGNGPAVTSNLAWLYSVDSVARIIRRHRLNAEGMPDRGEIFIQLGREDGHPDGIVLDIEDCLWVALWDGWGVRRYSPGGELLLHVPMPCARVTKLAFGGARLDTLYITTARTGLDETDLARQPLAGSLFSMKSSVAGSKLPNIIWSDDLLP